MRVVLSCKLPEDAEFVDCTVLDATFFAVEFCRDYVAEDPRKPNVELFEQLHDMHMV